MTKLLVVCLGVTLSLPVNQTFNLAGQIGRTPRAYFRFSTSIAKYTIRYDGFVEVYLGKEMNTLRKRSFYLKTEARGRLERVYFIEHEGDLFLRYDVIGQGSYVTRIEQRTRNQRWVRALNAVSSQTPTIYGDKVLVGDTVEISLADGRILRQD
jgi:hypothetical protein